MLTTVIEITCIAELGSQASVQREGGRLPCYGTITTPSISGASHGTAKSYDKGGIFSRLTLKIKLRLFFYTFQVLRWIVGTLSIDIPYRTWTAFKALMENRIQCNDTKIEWKNSPWEYVFAKQCSVNLSYSSWCLLWPSLFPQALKSPVSKGQGNNKKKAVTWYPDSAHLQPSPPVPIEGNDHQHCP